MNSTCTSRLLSLISCLSPDLAFSFELRKQFHTQLLNCTDSWILALLIPYIDKNLLKLLALFSIIKVQECTQKHEITVVHVTTRTTIYFCTPNWMIWFALQIAGKLIVAEQNKYMNNSGQWQPKEVVRPNFLLTP